MIHIKDTSEEKVYDAQAVEEAVALIKEIYVNDCEVVLGELFASLEISSTLEEAEEIVFGLRKIIDGGYKNAQ